MPERPIIVWFRRDLRLHDQPALTWAAEQAAPIVALFVVDPALVRGPSASSNRTWFVLESVRALRRSLEATGTELVVRVGDPRTIVPDLAASVGAEAVVVSRDHAPYGRARDRAIAEALAATGIAWHARRGNLIHEPEEIRTQAGRPFGVYSPFLRAWQRLDRRVVLDAPARLDVGRPAGLDPGPIPTLADLGLGEEPSADPDRLPEPGEPAARARLARWLEHGIDAYADTRDRLDLEDGTSRLSPDLHLGLLSPLEAFERAAGAGDGRRTFRKELVWREFYAHVLFHEPAVRHRAFRPAFDTVAWSTDADVLEAWRRGRTGYPVIDAAMRQLAATGWMPNRARMLVASFLTKDLLVDWRSGEAHFLRELVDGDVASNNGGWQWAASTGTDPQPYFRIFHPVTQGRRHDPDGAYVRRWLPELVAVPTARIHAPWEMTTTEQDAAHCRIGIDYPAPIVDHAEARSRALAAYEAARRTS